jgi:hypothetical protein
MIRWRDNQNIIRSAAKAANAMAAAVFLGVDSMISMYSVFVFLHFSAQMTVVNIPNDHHFIGYIAIVIHGHFKQGLAVKMSRLFRLTFLRDKAITGSLPSVRITCVIECLFPIFYSFDVRCLLSLIDGRKSVDKRLNLCIFLYFPYQQLLTTTARKTMISY